MKPNTRTRMRICSLLAGASAVSLLMTGAAYAQAAAPKEIEEVVVTGSSIRGAAPVGQFPANAYGLHDVAGNVWEWCEDWYNKSRREKVLRGGSWGYDPLSLLSSDRLYNAPNTRDMYRGFRCVLVSP